MKHVVGLLVIAFILSSVLSCKKDAAATVDLGYNYFPDQAGSYVVYDVDSFYYNDFTSHVDTFKFQLKEKIQSVFLDNENRNTLRLERYVRFYKATTPYSSLPWVLRDVWMGNRTKSTAEKVEENVRYVKLVFPVEKDKRWNVNAQNTNDAMDYSFAFADLKQTIGGKKFDSVSQVNQQNATTLISKEYYIEKYARNIGLIYKQVIDVQSQPSPLLTPTQLQAFYGTPIMQRVTSGTQYTYTVNSYGVE
jgi:hypothetical protein